MFLNSIHYFRAIAIVIIVVGHSYLIGRTLEPVTIYGRIFENFMQGGTHFFVFISGFLFFQVHYKKFSYSNLLKNRARKVLVPYLLMSALPIIYFTFHKHSLVTLFGLQDNYALSVLYRILTGYSLVPYWYIPVIMIIFLLSPMFVLFIRSDIRIQLGLFISLFALALFIHRPVGNINVFHSVLYFLPVYMLGILCSKYRDPIYQKFAGREFVLMLAALGLAVYQSFFCRTGNFEKEMFQFSGIDLMLLQKTALSIFFLLWLKKYENQDLKLLSFIARISFPIYFLHPYVFLLLKRIDILSRIPQPQGISEYLFVVMLMTAFVPAICAGVAVGIKKCMHGKSEMLIGW